MDPSVCECCAKVLHHVVKYQDGTGCPFHPGVEFLIRAAMLAEREACAVVVEDMDGDPFIAKCIRKRFEESG